MPYDQLRKMNTCDLWPEIFLQIDQFKFSVLQVPSTRDNVSQRITPERRQNEVKFVD